MKTEKKQNFVAKGLVVAATALLMMIPVLMVAGLVSQRERLSDEVENEIAHSWGGRQIVGAPEVVIPYKDQVESYDGKMEKVDDLLELSSAGIDVSGEISVQTLRRSIYDVPVYRAELVMSGKMTPDAVFTAMARGVGKCYMTLDMADYKGIEGYVKLIMNGKEYDFLPGDRFAKYNQKLPSKGLVAEIPVSAMNADKALDYKILMNVKGIEKLYFIPGADIYSMSLKSDYPSPGFAGAFLPSERNVTDGGFEAEWVINESNLYMADVYDSKFGVDFVVPVSQYQQTERAMKYSFMIILLIFMGIFLVEVISGKNVSIVQYIVTGLSLCLFYLLLLSFTEYMPFALAYTISSALTVVALGAYFAGILRSRLAYAFAGTVAAFYGFIYLLLSLESGSLLVGTMALFLVLCVMMYFTRNINRRGSVPVDQAGNPSCLPSGGHEVNEGKGTDSRE